MTAKGTTRVAVLALAAAGSAGFGFPPSSQLACPAGTTLRRHDNPGCCHELFCARADGKKHGPSRKFEGGVRTEGSYANGREIGIWRSWYENGKPFRHLRFISGSLDGPEITWDLDGTLISKGAYRAGEREGLWTVNDLSVTGRGIYRHDLREGWWSFSSEGHRIAAGAYRHGDLEGPWVFYWPGGGLESQGTFRHSLKQGRWRFYQPQGWLRVDIECRAGRAHGKFVALDEHGGVVMRGGFGDDAGAVERLDGTAPGFGLCGDECWARDHCHDKRDYRTLDDE
jgi:antitoxin component YwqK of YwqJK toxin-antitoxin module